MIFTRRAVRLPKGREVNAEAPTVLEREARSNEPVESGRQEQVLEE